MLKSNQKQAIKKKETDNINELVPLLINSISVYEDNLRDRVKINNIFNEFDLNARGKFLEFIELANKRYKRVKSGANISKIIFKQKRNYEELSNQILSNRFYTNDEIEIEAKKLLKKMNNKDKEIYQLRKGILKKTKDFSQKEIIKRERLASAAIERRKENEKKKKKYLLSHLDLIYRPGFSKKKQNLEINSKDLVSDDKNKLENEKSELLIKKKYYDDLMESDRINLNNNIKDYKDYLKDIENVTQNIKKEKDKENIHKKTFVFLTDGIKLLSYKDEEIVNDVPIKVEEPKIDIIKLMRFTKRGNKKFFKEELSKKSEKRIQAFKHKYPKFKYKSSKTCNNLNTLKRNNSGKSIKTDSHRKTSRNKIKIQKRPFSSNPYIYSNFSNYKNIIKTVKNEAEKVLNLNENFKIKKNKMDNFINSKNLPEIEDYDNLLNHNSSDKKNKTANIEINNNCYNLFKLLSNNAYHKKLELCGGGFHNSHRDEKTPLNILNETKKYLIGLNEVKLKIKKSNDSTVKQCLRLYKKNQNEILNIGKKIGKLKSHVKNEKDLKKLEEINLRKMKEEKKIQKEDELNMEYFKKIKQNLENDDSENVNAGINLKYMLSEGLVKKNNGNRAYEDFKEFFEIAKDKKAKKLYE